MNGSPVGDLEAFTFRRFRGIGDGAGIIVMQIHS